MKIHLRSNAIADADALLNPPQRPDSAHEDDARVHRRPAWRAWVQGMGLQGKLVLCFTYLICVALGVSCWLFARQSKARINDMMCEEARQLSYTLSLASKHSLETHQTDDLNQIGQDLLKSRNILFVAFMDADGNPLALASRDQEFDWPKLTLLHPPRVLTQVQFLSSPLLGEYLMVAVPVTQVTASVARNLPETTVGASSPTRLLGFVAIGLSQTNEHHQVTMINYLICCVGVMVVLCSLPLSYLLVRRIFLPIRQLVLATDQIIAGDLTTRVAIDRVDTIGMLARSFNEMVRRVRSQQQLLMDANTGLEAKVLERTGQLEAANKRLSSEIAEKEDFLRAVSHDLNAPLRNIAGMASMLLKKHNDKFDEDIVHRLQRIQLNVQMETDLIAELLELSRIKTRRQKLEMVELTPLVRDLEGMFESDLRSKQISLIIDSALPVIHAEQARLRQVFQNLIDNAIKYMGDGEKREIHIGSVQRKCEAEFYVRDTGIGIEQEDLAKVFHIFRRGKTLAVQKVSGKGVGLASVKSIIETYSGSIWAESVPGQGCTFRFTINGKYVPALAGASERDTAPVEMGAKS